MSKMEEMMKDEEKCIEEIKNAIMEFEKTKIESIDVFKNFVDSKELESFLKGFKGDEKKSKDHTSHSIISLSKTDIGKKVTKSLHLIADRWTNVVMAGMSYANKSIANDLDSQAISLFIEVSSEVDDKNEFFRVLTERLHKVSNDKGNKVLKKCFKEVIDSLKNDDEENKDDFGSVVLH